jgi:hypothetical protein
VLEIGPGLTEASASRELASMSAMYCWWHRLDRASRQLSLDDRTDLIAEQL